MPVVSPNSTVLVTGANGYLGLWIVRTLLEHGYTVRAAVRQGRGELLKDQFSSYGDKIEIVHVQDITKPGAFDDAVVGVDGILHTACPCNLAATEVSEYIDPAVDGTKSIMNSAATFGKGSVKRMVFTSSAVAVTFTPSITQAFDESEWNEKAIEIVKAQGDDAPNPAKYCAAKTLGEKAAWEFYEKNKNSISFDITTLNPPTIHGPILQPFESPTQMGYSMLEWYNTIINNQGTYMPGHIWIDVRDAALAHVLALERAEAGNERIIIAAGSYYWTEYLAVSNSISPPIYERKYVNDQLVPVDSPDYPFKLNAAKSVKILGIKYRSMEETAKDILVDFKSRGW